MILYAVGFTPGSVQTTAARLHRDAYLLAPAAGVNVMDVRAGTTHDGFAGGDQETARITHALTPSTQVPGQAASDRSRSQGVWPVHC